VAQVSKTDTSREKLRGESVRGVFQSARDLGATDLMTARAKETRALIEPRANLWKSQTELYGEQAEETRQMLPLRKAASKAQAGYAGAQAEYTDMLVKQFFPMTINEGTSAMGSLGGEVPVSEPTTAHIRGVDFVNAVVNAGTRGKAGGLTFDQQMAILKNNQQQSSERSLIERKILEDPKGEWAVSHYQDHNRKAEFANYIYVNIKGKIQPQMLPIVTDKSGRQRYATAQEIQNAADKIPMPIEQYIEMIMKNYPGGAR